MSVSALTGHIKVGGTYPLYITGTTVLSANEFDRVVALLTGAATLTLPSLASSFNGYELTIRNNSAAPQTLTVQGNGSELIGGANTAAVTQNQALTIICDHVHSKWQILFGPA